MSDAPKDKPPKKEKEASKASAEGSHGIRGKDAASKTKDCVSTVSSAYELGQNEKNTRMVVTTENTYQLGPFKRFPMLPVLEILKDVLTNYLEEETYEEEWSRQMAKTICEVIKARVKDLMIPRYKIVVLVHIGQLTGQSMQISSRCLWDAANDNFTSYSFKNSSLFSVASVYTVYFD